tara:strand:- start:1424 stop:1738 length:315 start_codon:yes stop_codon:yes gene_type:complete
MSKLKRGKLCPLIGEDCRELECLWYTEISGTHPQTGERISEWGCAVAWIPFMQMDQSKFLNQQGAAIESFRNEMKSTFSPIIPVENQLFTKEPIQINESNDNQT